MFKERTPVLKRIKEKVRPTPLRQRITMTLHRLKIQLRKMERTSSQLLQRDKILFNKCSSAIQAGDMSLASIYANECVEIRKIAKITLHSQIALEQVALRLETVKDFGDILYLVGPVAGIVGVVKDQIQNILPEISYELSEVDDSLRSVVLEIGEAAEQSFDFEASGEEAQKILEEAKAVAEQKMKERFPELPAGVPVHETSRSLNESRSYK
jgi:division protein CdvB (Snf7/Vps24/ESCRT-III family)